MSILPGFQSRRAPLMACAVLACALASAPALAQRYVVEVPRVDPATVLSLGDELLARAPDASIDRLFKAVHASSRSDDESAALCALFEPDAVRDVGAFQRMVSRLGPESRERFALALADIALGGFQATAQAQAFDPARAQQVLKQAAVTAAFLHEDFSRGMAADGADAAGREARCRSFRWLVGVLDGMPQADRVAATRWLLREGLTLARSVRAHDQVAMEEIDLAGQESPLGAEAAESGARRR